MKKRYIQAGMLVLLAVSATAQQPLHTWGDNRYGRLGYGTSASTEVPTKIGSAGWIAADGGDFFSVGIQADGTLWAWGNESEGKIGDGSVVGSADGVESPKQVGTDKDWIFVSAGSSHTVAIKKDHTLWGWGDNGDYALGNGSGSDLAVPTQIGNSTADWQFVAGGAAHTLAIKTDGTLWGWGDNGFGKLGDGSSIDRSRPVQIGTDNNWKMVAAGQECSLGLRADGTLWGWGQNTTGSGSLLVPTQIGTATDWKFIATAENSHFAIKTSGTLWAWGNNFVGQLGIGSSASMTVPTQVGTDNNWEAVSGGYMHTVALKTDHTIWGMGVGKPTGSTAALGENKPKQIGTSKGWYAIASGSGHVLALGLGSGTAIDEYGMDQDIMIYPNPVSDILHLAATVAQVSILNSAGRCLYTGTSTAVAVGAYPGGIYFYQLILKNGSKTAGSFYKQ